MGWIWDLHIPALKTESQTKSSPKNPKTQQKSGGNSGNERIFHLFQHSSFSPGVRDPHPILGPEKGIPNSTQFSFLHFQRWEFHWKIKISSQNHEISSQNHVEGQKGVLQSLGKLGICGTKIRVEQKVIFSHGQAPSVPARFGI